MVTHFKATETYELTLVWGLLWSLKVLLNRSVILPFSSPNSKKKKKKRLASETELELGLGLGLLELL